MSYTYDDMCRVRNCRTADLNTGIITNQSFNFDAASNVLADDCIYDVNNRLTSFKENSITYDADGNMTDAFLNEQNVNFVFDSRNRLISDGTHTYTYNAENTRIRSVCNNVETHYTYNTNASLSQLLVKRTGGNITKYVYGLGLIGEESQGSFKTYHFDYRGSTVAITDEAGIITDTFAYDTYGKLINRTGETNTPFLYNGRDGVMTEENGLYYMRARYYSPELKRFINADVVSGEIANSPTLNRYAYANGNPISNVDPLGLSAERGTWLDDIRNGDGTYSFYDNRRHNPNSVFHEQIISFSGSGPSASLTDGNFTLGSLQFNVITGGWEFEYVDLSLLDFLSLELSGGLNNGNFDLSAMASIYSPSITIDVGIFKLTLGAEIGSIGASIKAYPEQGKYGIKAALGFGADISFDF